MADSLETQLQKSFLWLERYKGETPAIIKENLDIAQKKILELIATTQNQRVIKSEVNKILNEAFASFESVMIEDKSKIEELTYNATSVIMANWTTINSIKIPNEVKKRLANPNTLIQGHTLDDHLSHLNRTTTRKIQGQILQGFENGQGIQEINREIRNTFGVVERNQLNTLTRTMLLESIRDSQNESFDYFEDEIEFYVYSSTLDSRTTLYCLNWSNYKSKDRKKVQEKLSSHFNCRSIMIVETDLSRKFDEDQKQNLVQWDSRTVSHRDGTSSKKFSVNKVKKIPTNTKGQQAFDFFDDKFKLEYLGPTRYKLYKDGKATLKQMTDLAKNTFIPLDELERKLNL